MSNSVEVQKADVAVAKERAQGAVIVTVFFEHRGNVEQTELDPGETVSGAFSSEMEAFEKFVRVESDKEEWGSLSDVLGFEKC